jgi:hypothetical protein
MNLHVSIRLDIHSMYLVDVPINTVNEIVVTRNTSQVKIFRWAELARNTANPAQWICIMDIDMQHGHEQGQAACNVCPW